jgi:hypothetical protein
MDDLDRLAFRLVRTARESYPHLLSHGFSLTDVEERLLPFRETRREMANGGADAWEANVLRLLSGERDYVAAEPALQAACRQALQHSSPSVSLVRSWATTTLMLGRGASRIGATDGGVAATSTGATAVAHSVTRTHALPTRGCRYCGCRLPEGRVITFCPHCGHDLTKRQCPACSTEMEMGWSFCVTCGRGAEIDGQEVGVLRRVGGS